MHIAIHHSEGSFSGRWISYCQEKKIPYKIVNCYDTNINDQIKDCDILMWHYHHGNFKDVLFAKQLLFSMEQAGKKVFPNFNTSWHFDDKVGQKYLLEAVGAPLVSSYVFYEKKTAKVWVNQTSFPKVFKLRGGAGAQNVSLISDRKAALKKIKIAYGKGFSQFNRLSYFIDTINKYKARIVKFDKVIKSFGRLFIGTEFNKWKGKERGYFYIQDFIPNNNSDIRVIVIGKKAFAIKRLVRQGDFRASGSGKILYLDESTIDKRTLEIAFETSEKLNAQCIAYDFVFDENNKPLIVEISFGFASQAYDLCPGFWDNNLKWNKEKFVPQDWMVDVVIHN
ncbi:hypothetical protein GCM10007103_29180 [Salinimicrobium marinum]|uniref:ATP-grasp fold RimK-type domain-containing protein n=1 Tax=Salinimicrobium marinum TaxID=680283 RepID=A0A918W1A6_9FLAO|nr:hypothetical protein [Salinimicrobium marinum]GHA46235.1 hypothetical protein GCM10007103_29180 [Salinimicrobium marinum]